MKRTFFIFSVIIMVVMAMSFVGCDKHETIEPSQTTEDSPITQLKSSKSYADYGEDLAYQYALDHNGENSTSPYNTSVYISYSPNDCANFISQCLYAGGIRPDADDNYTWWYDFYYQYTDPYDKSTYAWRSVSGLYNYLKGKYYTKEYYIVSLSDYNAYKSEAKLGDLVFSMESASHAMIITNIVKSGSTITDVQYSGHTVDRENHTLYYVWNNLPTWAGFRVIRLL